MDVRGAAYDGLSRRLFELPGCRVQGAGPVLQHVVQGLQYRVQGTAYVLHGTASLRVFSTEPVLSQCTTE